MSKNLLNKSCFWLKQLYPNVNNNNNRIFEVGLIFPNISNELIKDDSYFISTFVFDRSKIGDIFTQDKTLGYLHLFNIKNNLAYDQGFINIKSFDHCVILDTVYNPIYINKDNWDKQWLYVAYL